MEYFTEISHINFTNKSSIKIYNCSENILNYITNNFDDIFELHPTYNNDQKSKIMLYNKQNDNPYWNEIEINRWYKSYLQTPKFDSQYKKSYMFSGISGDEISDELPELIKPIYNEIYNFDNNYNQIVVNWYENENDYIELHSDWTDNMIDNYNIGILNMYSKNHSPRILNIENKKTNEKYSIELLNGQLIQMCGEFQNEFRHGIPKLSNNNIESKRIGISFRQYKP